MTICLPLPSWSVQCNGSICKTQLTHLGTFKVQLPRGWMLPLKTVLAKTLLLPSVLSRVCEFGFLTECLKTQIIKGKNLKDYQRYIILHNT